jgi:hypothetical protein
VPDSELQWAGGTEEPFRVCAATGGPPAAAPADGPGPRLL